MTDAVGTDLQRSAMALRVVWAAMLVSVIMSGVACFFVIRAFPGAPPHLVMTFRSLLWAVAVVVGALTFRLRPRPPAAAMAAMGAGGAAAGNNANTLVAQLTPRFVATWVCGEAVALLGFVLAVLSHSFGDFLPFGAAAAFLLYLHRPAGWPFDGRGPRVEAGTVT